MITRAPRLLLPVAGIAGSAMLRFNRLSRRERWLVIGTLVAGLGALGDVVLLQPVMQERKALMASIEAGEKRISELSSAANAAGGASLARVAEAQKQIVQLDEELEQIRSSVTPPEKMAARLRELLGAGRGLTVLGFRNMAAIPVSGDAADRKPGASAASGLYRHPIEVRLAGSYADLVDWIGRIERDGNGLRLSKVACEAQAGQPIEARIELFTLGTEQTWLTL